MAALDDELGLPEYESGTITGAAPAAQSALGDDEEPTDYGGGQDQYAGPPSASLLADPRVQARLASPRVPEFARQRLAELTQQQQQKPPDYQAMMSDPVAMQREMQSGTELQYPSEPKPPPKQDDGWMSILGRGLMRATEDIKQGKDVAEGKKPRGSKTPEADYEKPPELADFASPTVLAEKLVFGLARSSPSVALSIAGSFAGGAIGSAVTGPAAPIGGTVGAITGGAAGMGLGAALQEIGPAYYAELQATPDDVDSAWDRAMVTVGKSGLVGAASMALFGAGKPLANFAKGFLAKPVLDAAGTAVAPVAGIPLRAGVQAIGQPAISAGGQAAENVIEGKPITTNLDQAVAGGLANVVPDVVASVGGRVGNRILRGKPGVNADQELALDATQPTQGELPLPGGQGVRPPPPVGPGGQMELPLPPGAGERPPVQGEQLELPDILGPGRQPLGDIVPPGPRGPEPVQGELPLGQGELPGMGRRPPEAEPPAGTAPPEGPPPAGPSGQGELPLGPPQPPPPTPVGGPQLELPTAPTQMPLPLRVAEAPVPRPGGAQPELPGLGATAQRPGIQPELPGTAEPVGLRPTPPPEAAARPIGAVEPPVTPEPSARGPIGPSPVDASGRTPEGWTIEPDHTGIGHVVKNADGNVISVGDTPQQAVEFARARHPDNVKPAENIEPVQEAPPAAAGTEPAAEVGRDTAPETPAQTVAEAPPLTKAEEVKAKGAARAAKAEKAKPEQTGTDTVTSAKSDRSEKSPSFRERLKASIAELDARNAPDADYQGLLSTGSKSKRPGETWRDKAVSFAGEDARTEKVAPTTRSKTAETMTATELRGALRELGLGPSYTAKMKVAELRDLYRNELSGAGERTKTGAYAGGEGPDVTSRPAESARPQSTSTPVSRGARAEMDKLSGKGMARGTPQPLPGERAPVGTNVSDRIAPYLVDKVLNREMSVAQAHEAYGVQKEVGEPGRGPGAPRQHRDLASYLRDALKRADDPSIETQLKATLAGIAEQAKGKITPNVRAKLAAATKQLDALLAHEQNVKARRAEHQAILTELEGGGPSGVLAARVFSPHEYAARRPEVHDPLMRALESGDALKLHDYLDLLTGNPAAVALAPHLVELTRALRRILPNVPVLEVGDRLGPGTIAGYRAGTDQILINSMEVRREGAGLARTMVHEGIHGGTAHYIDRLFTTPEAGLSATEFSHKRALSALRGEVMRVVEEGTHTGSVEGSLWYAAHYYSENGTPIGPHELATMIFTNDAVYQALSREKASPKFRADLKAVGMELSRSASIWDGFKRIVRNILGLTERQDSVLDWAMRPLGEVIEHGSAYRADMLKARAETLKANREVLNTPIAERTALSMENLRSAGRTVGDKLDTVWRTGLRGAFQGATTSAIHDFIKHLTPSVTDHRTALENVTHASEAERIRKITTRGPNGEAREEASIDKAMRLRKELTEGPDARAVNELMTDATQAGMSVINPSRNAHVRTQDQIDIQRALQDRFDALDPRAKQTYREVNEYHNELYRAEREAAVKDFVERSFPDLTSAEHDVIREQMRTRQGVEDVLARADATPVARMMGQRWAAKSDLVKLIAESQKAGFVDGDYFPLRRHGEYIVSAGEHGKPNYLVQMFETASAARLFRADLERTRNDVSQVFVKSKTKPQDLAPQQALSTLDRAMERAGLTGTAADVLRDMYAGQLIQQGTRAATRTMKREGIAGASTDQARNLLVDFLAHTARIGHLTHGGEAVRTLYQVDREVQGLRGPNRGPTSTVASARDVAIAQTGAEELRRRMAPADGDVSADWTGRGTRGLTTLTVLNTLMRPAHFFMQLAGTHVAATSLIAARHNLAAVGAVNRAFAQLTGTAAGAARKNAMAAWNRELKASNWILSDLYLKRLQRDGSGIASDHAKLLIDRLNQAGLSDHTKMRELQRMAGPQGFGGHGINFISRFLDVAGAGEHALDSAMRIATAKAAFELELRRSGGKDVNGALDYAVQMARDSQPDYNFHNKSRLATAQGSAGRLAPIITQYKQFGLHMYGVQGNLLAAGIRNAAGSVERREAYKALALLQASHAVMYGGIAASVFGSLPVMFGMGLYDWATGGDRPSSATIVEAQARNWVRDMTGSKTVADIFDKGVPMAFGADVHRSLQFTNLLGVPELKSFDKPGMMNLAVQVITGASGDTAAGMVESAGKIIGGDTRAETIAKMMPRIIRDPAEALIWGQRGVTTPRGDLTVLPADRVTLGTQIAKGLGFIPPVVSDAREARAVIQLAEKVSENTHGKILNRLVEAAPADRKGVIEEITRFNKENPADPITGQMIQQRLKQQAQINAQPGLYGVRGVAKRDIASRTDLARFANP